MIAVLAFIPPCRAPRVGHQRAGSQEWVSVPVRIADAVGVPIAPHPGETVAAARAPDEALGAGCLGAVERRTARLEAEGRRWQRAAFSFGPRLYCGAPLHPRAFATTPVKWLGGVCVRRPRQITSCGSVHLSILDHRTLDRSSSPLSELDPACNNLARPNRPRSRCRRRIGSCLRHNFG